jgi:hypothetical protein
MERKKEVLGLVRLRRQGSGKAKPQHNCDNCHCNRYSPCTCKRAKNK